MRKFKSGHEVSYIVNLSFICPQNYAVGFIKMFTAKNESLNFLATPCNCLHSKFIQTLITAI